MNSRSRPVARIFPSRHVFCPVAVRSQLMAIYGFARLTDDIGDEATVIAWRCSIGSTTNLISPSKVEAIHPVFQRLTPGDTRAST